MSKHFSCTFDNCEYETTFFNRLLVHIWDKHSLVPGFSHKCNISSCPKVYTNIRSFKNHLKCSHPWFFEKHVKVFGKKHVRGEQVVDNCDNYNESQDLDTEMPSDDEEINQTIVADYEEIVSGMFLECRETYHCTTEAITFLSEKLKTIMELDRKVHSYAIRESIKKNHPDFIIDYETSTHLDCESQFSHAFQKFSGKKALSNYIKGKAEYISPVQINIGMNTEYQKPDSIQYIPLFSTLKMLLQHEDVLGEVVASSNMNHENLQSFSDGSSFKNNALFNSEKQSLQVVLYHDDFNVANPLGNKTVKYKISAFYFVLGNLPSKYRACLKDINLLILCRAALVEKYGYQSILALLIDDLLVLHNVPPLSVFF